MGGMNWGKRGQIRSGYSDQATQIGFYSKIHMIKKKS